MRSISIVRSAGKASPWCKQPDTTHATFYHHVQKSEDTYNHILKYTGLLGGVQVFYILMSIIRNKFTALFIGPWGMGVVVVYTKAAEFIGSATNFGISFSAVRRLSELHDRGERRAVEQYVKLIRTWTLLTAALGIIVCALFAPILSMKMLGSHHTTRGFIILSPMVGMLTLLGGELAILKGLRMLRRMATVSAIGAVLTMLLTALIYALLGVHGILPVLLSTTAVTLLLNLHATTRDYPYRVGLRSMNLLRRGGHLIKLGTAFILAGMLGSGADMVIAAFISRMASPHAVGLYGAGFTLIVSYARLVFVAMDADFFPRLSAAGEDCIRRNTAINRQIDVLVVLMGPFLILFSLFLPLLVPLLYSRDFMLVIPMAICAISYMFFKAVYAPIAYLPLARGDSFVYLGLEALYDAIFVICVAFGFYYRGLVGAGLGLSLANLFELITISTVYRFRYAFRFDTSTIRRAFLQYALLAMALFAAATPMLLIKILLGATTACLSITLSWKLIRQETSFMEKFSKLRRKTP